MGWIQMVVLAAILFGALWRFARLPSGALLLVGAAMLIAMAGYGWQARPGLIGSPYVERRTAAQDDSAFALLRGDLMGRFGRDQQVLDFADAMHRMDRDGWAVRALLTAIRANPKSSILWTGLGNALTLAAKGNVTPPARFAFDRAAQLAPAAPGPPFFLGLALIQSGNLDDGADLWRDLLARTPPGVSWREDVAIRLAIVDRFREAQRP
jgi:cytochrome c-type biogenesis protein CcmH/NrfG